MEIRGMTPEQLSNLVFRVSGEHYDGNVVCEWDRRTWMSPSVRWMRGGVPSFRGRIVVESSRGSGARRAASGRRMPAACWHAFRDVFRQAFQEYPGARFATSLARYTAENFETTYPATGYVNVGSMIQPARMVDMCECTNQPVEVPDMPTVVRTPHAISTVRPVRPSLLTNLCPRPSDEWAAERDQALAIAAGECAWCGGSTMGEAFAWCDPECQEQWQRKYGA